MGYSFTAEERKAREAVVLEMINEGMNVRQMAAKLNCSTQAMHNFLNRRGWKVKKPQ